MSRASEWAARGAELRAAEAEELELPSGAKILARRPDPMQLAVWGRIPLQMAAAAVGSPEDLGLTETEAVELAQFYRDLLLYCCVEPRISQEPTGEEEIHPSAIPRDDWQFIVHWAMRYEEGRDLRGFRGGRSGAGDCGGGEDVEPAAIDAAGDRGPGFSARI
jgi:hypothetical protein